MNSWAQGEGQPGLGYIMFPLNVDGILDLTDKEQRAVRDRVEKLREQGKIAEAVKVLEAWQAESRSKAADAGPVPGVGPIANNIGAERTEMLRRQLGLKAGDAVFFVAGAPNAFVRFAGAARTKIADELGLIDKDRFELCWIVDFPMYEWNEEEKKIDFSHNPFSMPNMPAEEFLALDPADREKILALKAVQYDVVCNGVELSSGAIRNHRPDVMKKAFAIAGYDEDELRQRFGGMLHALSLGAPPHGGIAPGIDRIVMLLCGEENLREVVLFPMNQRAEDLMMGAPSKATAKQLRELHIRVVDEDRS